MSFEVPVRDTDPSSMDIQCLGDWDGDGVTDLLCTRRAYAAEQRGVVVRSVTDGRVLATLRIPEVDLKDSVGVLRACPAGDLDGDRRDDALVVSRACTAGGDTLIVSAYGSSKTVPIWTRRSEIHGPSYPSTVQRVGDLDQDGVPDFVIGTAPESPQLRKRPTRETDPRAWIEARSGRDGHSLWSLVTSETLLTATELAPFVDVDGDEVPEVAVVNAYGEAWDKNYGIEDRPSFISLRSGKTGSAVGRIIDTTGDRSFHSPTSFELCSGEDVDGDGVSDLAVRSLLDREEAVVFSGRTRLPLARLTPHPDPAGRLDIWFPSAIAIASDLDGDGWRDMLLGHDEVGTEMGADYGAIYVKSSRTNELLAAVWGTPEDYKLGMKIAWLGDTDHDGRPEFAAVTTGGIKVWSIEGVPASPAKGAGAK